MIRRILVTTALCAAASLAVLVVSGPGMRSAAVTGTAELANWGFDTGGGESSSDSYGAGWTTGELALGEAESENFGAAGGFRAASLCFDDNDGLDEAAEAALGTSTCAFDSDVDGLGDAADACPTFFTSWLTPLGDGDCDSWLAGEEGAEDDTNPDTIGTDPNDNCANNSTHDAYPADFDNNKIINVFDILSKFPTTIGLTKSDGNWVSAGGARSNLDGNSLVNAFDILRMSLHIGYICS